MSTGLAAWALAAVMAGPAAGQEVAQASGAVLRGLDRMSGERIDLDVAVGGAARLGRLRIRVEDCRYPTENPSGDAFAFLTISDASSDAQLFQGWMVASSPALNPLDHSRYDIWVLRCSNV